MNVSKAVDKAFETKSFKELAAAPVSALQGVTDADGALLKQAFGVNTIADLANLKYVKWAQAITAAAAVEA